MKVQERKERLIKLAQAYLYHKRYNFGSTEYSISHGRLDGFCIALNIERQESEDTLWFWTGGNYKLIYKCKLLGESS